MPQGLKRLACAVLAALGAHALPGAALELGEPQLRSRLGQPLDARIPIQRRADERIALDCFTAIPASPEGAVPAEGVALALRRNAGRAELRASTRGPVVDPAVAFGVRVACPGLESADHVFIVLPDPARTDAPSPADTNAFAAREGDTLTSLSRALVPGNAAAQQRWREALRARDPALATIGDDEPLPSGTRISVTPARAEATNRPAPPGAATPRLPPPPRVAAAPPAQLPSAPEELAKAAPPPAPAATAKRAAAAPSRSAAPPKPQPVVPRGDFVLKLSATEVDLSRSAHFDDRMRAELRERQLVLDADDQVSALLAMRHSVKQLETQVALLQLKLSTLPAMAPPAAAPQPTVAPQPAAVAPPDALPQPVAPAKPAAMPAATPPAKPGVPSLLDEYGVLAGWILGGILALLVVALAVRAVRRRREAQPGWSDAPATQMMEPEDPPVLAGEAVDFPVDGRPAMASDAMLTTRLAAADSDALRQRYIEERFPEVASGTVALDDPASLIKGARLFYEDGALPRAVELLQFAIEERPDEIRTWLALFEIFRLERLTGEFAQLAGRFAERHGTSDAWRKVRYFGREIDPGNPLYREDVVGSLETIGPREARRLAANAAPVDPIAENWLDAPMDFENEVLANELRNALMGEARLTDADLVPNPMPALRNLEMFTVA